MNFEEVEKSIANIDSSISKIKELLADAKICNSDITKTLISSAIKKYASIVADFKLPDA